MGKNIIMEKQELYELIEKAIAGDRDAFEELYTQYVRVILFHTRKLIDVSADVEDVAQEIVLQMLGSITRLKSPYAFSSWMYRVITNICYAHNTKHGSSKSESDIDTYADVLVEKDGDTIPEVSLNRTELDEAIIGAVDKLPEGQRLALFMHYYEQMSYKEIASALKITVSTVGTNILKAKKALKNIIEQEQIITSEDINTLRGVAIAPALAHAFDIDLGSISAAEVEHFRQKCDPKIAEYIRRSGSAAAKSSASAGKFIALGIGALAVISCIALVNMGPQIGGAPDSEPPSVSADQPEPYIPNAQIVLQSADGQPGQIDPYEATLVLDEGTAVSWSIISESAETVFSGEGTSFSAELAALQSGKYRIEWLVQNQDGQSARVVREIEIQ
jgi:RNA polymerase sigma-70 factor (ECF subfamily)